MNKFFRTLLPVAAFLMAFGRRVSGDEYTDNTSNYDYTNLATPAPLYFDDNSNAIYYPDGYQACFLDTCHAFDFSEKLSFGILELSFLQNN